MELVFSDEALAIVVPIAAYWVYSGVYMALGRSMDQYRLPPREEERSKNLVPKHDLINGILVQQLLQAAVAVPVPQLKEFSVVIQITLLACRYMNVEHVIFDKI
ncbi:putative hydroxylase [Hordeum vulgare]|nr:putative hydroxylase [Hordeum vulgare]